jgi:hypothetical protein
MGALVSKIIFKRGSDASFNMDKYDSLNDIAVQTLAGQNTTMGALTEGANLFLVVNVASK